jgi:hypothetical protein
MTSASTRSVSHNLADGDAEMTDPPSRPSRDPEDTLGDDKRRPDAPTEPPNKPEGTRGRRSRKWVEMGVSRASRAHVRADEVEKAMLRVLRDVKEERRAGKPNEPPRQSLVESRDPREVEVEPGGKTGEAERSKHAAHENADAEANGDVVWTCQDVQVEVESARTRVRGSATVYARSTKTVSAARWTSRTHLRIPQSLHFPCQISPQASSSRGRGEVLRAAMLDSPAAMWTRREHPGVLRTTETCRGSWERRQTASTNARSEELEPTYLTRPKTSQTPQAARRPYQTTSRAPRKALETLETSAPTKWTHLIEIEVLEAIEANRSC